jgi:4-carboxymuconolactone decarboxylase
MARRRPTPRLPKIPDDALTTRQRELRDAILSGPRGKLTLDGPFAAFLHAPDYGDLAQRLGAHCRFHTTIPPRLSEFAILVTARHWRAQYEWFAHSKIAARVGVAPQTISDLRAGRRPRQAPPDELAIYDFVRELYRTRRVSDPVYRRVHKLLGDNGMVEFVGILGYYVLISMTLNVFRADIPAGEDLPFPNAEG